MENLTIQLRSILGMGPICDRVHFPVCMSSSMSFSPCMAHIILAQFPGFFQVVFRFSFFVPLFSFLAVSIV